MVLLYFDAHKVGKFSGLSGVGKVGVERMPSSVPPNLLEIIVGTTFAN